MHDVVLPSGERIEIRPIAPADRDALLAGFHALDKETRFRRFHSHIAELTPEQLRYFTVVDQVDHVAYVAVAGGAIIGAARFIRIAHAPDVAELAIVVGAPWQRHGLGGALLRALIDRAGVVGVSALRAQMMFLENHGMRRLLESTGCALRGAGLDSLDLMVPESVRRAS